jgi:2-oxoglutarate ferredoxin oxidoreductase subunit beta
MAWCPGCGNFPIREALAKLEIPPHRVVLVTGIGQAAKIVHYMQVNGFNGLHGRTLAAAAGIKMANKDLVVIAESGDGDIYGEGGNHLIHNIRRNLDITLIVHDNRVYGLTKGQASPTSDLGFVTKVQTFGVLAEPLRPLPWLWPWAVGSWTRPSPAIRTMLPRSPSALFSTKGLPS